LTVAAGELIVAAMQPFAAFMAKPGNREATANFGWLAIEKAARLLCSVVVGFWVARHLGPGDFGRLNYALALVGFGLVFAEGGIDAVARRELVQAPQRAGALLAAIWRMRLTAGIVCYGVALAWAVWGTPAPGDGLLLAATGLMLFQPALAVADLWLQANLRSRTAVLAQLIALGLGAVGRIALIEWQAPLWAFGAVGALEGALAAGLLTRGARRAGLRVAAGSDTRALIGRLARETWPMLLSGVAISIYMRIDIVMLRNLVGAGAAGQYAAATRLSEIGYFIPVALSTSLLPALLRSRAAGAADYAESMQRYCDLSAALGYGLAIPLALGAPWLVRLAYGEAFAPAAAVLTVHAWAAVFVFIGVARGQFLVNEGLTRFNLVATATGALANVALNLLLIPRLGGTGAAIATVVSYAAAAWLASFAHPAVRATAWRQTRALLLPFRVGRYLRRS
jgi:PST family polysaccharide transporter